MRSLDPPGIRSLAHAMRDSCWAAVVAQLQVLPPPDPAAARLHGYTAAAGNGPAHPEGAMLSPSGAVQRIPDPGRSVVYITSEVLVVTPVASPGGKVSGCQPVAWGASWYSPEEGPPIDCRSDASITA